MFIYDLGQTLSFLGCLSPLLCFCLFLRQDLAVQPRLPRDSLCDPGRQPLPSQQPFDLSFPNWGITGKELSVQVKATRLSLFSCKMNSMSSLSRKDTESGPLRVLYHFMDNLSHRHDWPALGQGPGQQHTPDGLSCCWLRCAECVLFLPCPDPLLASSLLNLSSAPQQTSGLSSSTALPRKPHPSRTHESLEQL